MAKQWSPPPKGEAGSGVTIEAAKLDAPDHIKACRRRQSIYRDRPIVAALVRQALTRCGGEIRP